MPHWYGVIQTSSPPLLEGCHGDPERVREQVFANAPHGASVRTLSFLSGQDRAALTVEGPAARDYLTALEATDVVELMNAQERKAEKS